MDKKYKIISLDIARANDSFSSMNNQVHDISSISEILLRCLKDKGTIYLCGNGGSAADSQHIAAEFTGRFLKERESVPAISLTTNTSVITAIGNDYGYDKVSFTGHDPSPLSLMADFSYNAPSLDTPRIQECHILCLHTICNAIEQGLFK